MRQIAVILIFILAGIATTWVISCKKSGESSTHTTPLQVEIPAGFPAPKYDFTNNPVTKEGFELGRRLFYDGKLSKDGNFPCASCHQQFAAFSTFDHDLSHGFNNQFTTRNAPGLFNMIWLDQYQWDGGINNLEVQPLAPITAPNEMAEDIGNVVKKLQADAEYPSMFKAAFGSDQVTSQNMLKALTQFVAMMVSANSKYDKVKRGEAQFNVSEQAGYESFKQKCAACHQEPLFTDLSYRNDGFSINTSLHDVGRMRITGKSEDSLKFKVPSLRNVALSEPYIHDGRILSIGQMIDHYTTGIINSPTLDPLLKNGIQIGYAEKYNLIDFLKTLSDSSFIADTRFSQPQQ